MKLTIKTRYTGIPTQQARETGAPWTDTSVNNRWYLLLKLDNVGFQASSNGRHVLFELFDIRNSDGYIKQYALRLTGIPTQQQWETGSP